MTRLAPSAIIGTGVSALVRKYDLSADIYAAQAIDRAVEDAGLVPAQIDGLLINRSPVATDNALTLNMQNRMGYRQLSLLAEVDGEGSSAMQMVQMATLAIQAGMATRIACVFADTPLKPNMTGSDAFGMALPILDFEGWEQVSGIYGPVGTYALFASFHMARYGITEEQLSSVAISDRAWAVLNPDARLRTPLTPEAYFRAPVIAHPLRMLDCAYPLNGAAAFVITSAADAKTLSSSDRPPAYIHGFSQAHTNNAFATYLQRDEISAARLCANRAYEMAGIGPKDVDSRQFYEAFSYTNLVSLEEYGFCERGESGELAASGALAPGGHLPTNTGGGQLSCSYLQGMTPLLEGVAQVRGSCGARQVASDVVLVTGVGGFLQHQACVILSPHRSLN